MFLKNCLEKKSLQNALLHTALRPPLSRGQWHQCRLRDKHNSPKTPRHSWDTSTVTNAEKINHTINEEECRCLNFGKLKICCRWYFSGFRCWYFSRVSFRLSIFRGFCVAVLRPCRLSKFNPGRGPFLFRPKQNNKVFN